MSTLALDRIQSSLSRLKLLRMDEILEQTIKISAEEVTCKEQRRVETALKI